MIRNRCISRLKRYHLSSRILILQLKGNRKVSGSGGSMIARWKLEGIDGEKPQDVESAAQFDSTRKSYQAQMLYGATDWEFFCDLANGGAWPLLVRGVNCLPYCDNERDERRNIFFESASDELDERVRPSRSVMPFDTLGCTRTIMNMTERFLLLRERMRFFRNIFVVRIEVCNSPHEWRMSCIFVSLVQVEYTSFSCIHRPSLKPIG